MLYKYIYYFAGLESHQGLLILWHTRVTLELPIFFEDLESHQNLLILFVLTYFEILESHQDILGYLVYTLDYVSICKPIVCGYMKHIEPMPIGHS